MLSTLTRSFVSKSRLPTTTRPTTSKLFTTKTSTITTTATAPTPTATRSIKQQHSINSTLRHFSTPQQPPQNQSKVSAQAQADYLAKKKVARQNGQPTPINFDEHLHSLKHKQQAVNAYVNKTSLQSTTHKHKNQLSVDTDNDLIVQERNIKFPTGFVVGGAMLIFLSYTATIFFDFQQDFKDQAV